MARWRKKATAGLSGTVVEIGFGSGLNMPVYPPEVHKVYAVEPALTARRLAEERVAASHVDVEHIGLDGASIPLDDASCDGALATFTLCTIPGVEAALAEVHRVLRPGGRFHFLEHGLAPDASIVTWQRRIEPLQKRLADGCHLTRPHRTRARRRLRDRTGPVALRQGPEAVELFHRGFSGQAGLSRRPGTQEQSLQESIPIAATGGPTRSRAGAQGVRQPHRGA
jgi:SAM-dependent methyltransferase